MVGRLGITSACAEQTTCAMAIRRRRTDHLRVCGADLREWGEAVAEQGSPPRVRSRLSKTLRPRWCGVGSPPRVRSRLLERDGTRTGLRITSACAEQTLFYAFLGLVCWDHLRVCGADAEWYRVDVWDQGSPPRVRSRLHQHPKESYENGDHLRVCGADLTVKTENLPSSGSPPRVRSRQSSAAAVRWYSGITSACAEQTTRWLCRASWPSDHLRVCGADRPLTLTRTPVLGSPPRVRSRRRSDLTSAYQARITSACAEQTAIRWKSSTSRWDHLRVCGADQRSTCRSSQHYGSPPRVRSRPQASGRPVSHDGITSACAEQTRTHGQEHEAVGDHLRVCGAD